MEAYPKQPADEPVAVVDTLARGWSFVGGGYTDGGLLVQLATAAGVFDAFLPISLDSSSVPHIGTPQIEALA